MKDINVKGILTEARLGTPHEEGLIASIKLAVDERRDVIYSSNGDRYHISIEVILNDAIEVTPIKKGKG